MIHNIDCQLYTEIDGILASFWNQLPVSVSHSTQQCLTWNLKQENTPCKLPSIHLLVFFWSSMLFVRTSWFVIWNMRHTLQWHHNEHDCVSDHQPHDCLLNRLFRRRSKKTSKLRVTGPCVGTSPGPVNSPHKGPVTRKMLSFDDVIMTRTYMYQWLAIVFVASSCNNKMCQMLNLSKLWVKSG